MGEATALRYSFKRDDKVSWTVIDLHSSLSVWRIVRLVYCTLYLMDDNSVSARSLFVLRRTRNPSLYLKRDTLESVEKDCSSRPESHKFTSKFRWRLRTDVAIVGKRPARIQKAC